MSIASRLLKQMAVGWPAGFSLCEKARVIILLITIGQSWTQDFPRGGFKQFGGETEGTLGGAGFRVGTCFSGRSEAPRSCMNLGTFCCGAWIHVKVF